MRKGHIIIIVGIVLAILSVPMALAFTQYDDRTIYMSWFEDAGTSGVDEAFVYLLEDISPGTIIVKARDYMYSIDSIHVEVREFESGKLIDEYDLSPGVFLWNEGKTHVKSSGDYQVTISFYDENDLSYLEFEMEYESTFARISLLMAVIGFPTLLVGGIVGIVWGTFIIRRKEGPVIEKRDEKAQYKYEGSIAYKDEKEEEWGEYETSPRRKELWLDAPKNPYDDIPDDYYSQKLAESKAFDQMWHQKAGNDIEQRIRKRIEKMERKRDPDLK